MDDTIEKRLRALYYDKEIGLQSAIELQADYSAKFNTKLNIDLITDFIADQDIAQLHKSNKPSAHLLSAKFNMPEVNHTHQMDIMFMPEDKSGSKYILCVIDIASRFKAARPLKSKNADTILSALKAIYGKKSPLKFPHEMMVDPGSEFRGIVAKWFEDNSTIMKVAAPQHHKTQGFVEIMNKLLAIRLFKFMQLDGKSIEEPSDNWVQYLAPSITYMNKRFHTAIKMRPINAVKQEIVKQNRLTPNDIKAMDKFKFTEKDQVRYLLQLDETIDKKHRRATDNIWSPDTYFIDQIIEQPDQPTLYYLMNDKATLQHGFTSLQLMRVKVKK